MTPTQFALLTENVIAYARASELRFHCDFEEPEDYPGACNAYPCCQLATVHHLATEQDVCLAHFNRLEHS